MATNAKSRKTYTKKKSAKPVEQVEVKEEPKVMVDKIVPKPEEPKVEAVIDPKTDSMTAYVKKFFLSLFTH